MKVAIAEVLRDEGYIESFEERGEGVQKVLRIFLRYAPGGRGRDPVLMGIQRISKPGLRVYTRSSGIPRVFGGLGTASASFNGTYLRFFDAFICLYDGQYPIMGNAQVMTAKVAWDNACYWAINALLFFQRRLRVPEFMASIDPMMRRFFLLHARMQQFLSAWFEADRGTVGKVVLVT